MTRVCRQCRTAGFSAAAATFDGRDAALTHLILVHPSRALWLYKTVVNPDNLFEGAYIDDALRNRGTEGDLV